MDNKPHYQICFFCSDERYCLPETSITIPASATQNELNNVVNKLLSDKSDNGWQRIHFDFLIGNIIVRNSLQSIVQENDIATESIIRIECILREAAPVPRNEIKLADWIGAIRSSNDFIACAIYDGSMSLCSHKGFEMSNIFLHDDAIKCLHLFENGERRIATGGSDQIIILSDVINEKNKPHVLPTHVLRGHERSIECIAGNKDGNRLVSGSFDQMLKVWNTDKDDSSTYFSKISEEKTTKKKKTDVVTKLPMVTLSGHKDAIVGIAWMPNSDKNVVTVSWDHTIMIWDLELAGHIKSLPSSKSFTSISVSPSNGLFITGSVDSIPRLWDPRSKEGSFVKQTYIGHKGWVASVRWSPSDDHLFISSSFDKSTKLWDTRINKTPLYDLLGHTDRLLCCDWSLKQLIATGGADSSIKTFSRNSF